MLIAANSGEDAEAITRAVGRSHPEIAVEFVPSGADVMPRLSDPAAPGPSLLLLDVTMRGETGTSVLRAVRAVPESVGMTIIVLASSTSPADIEAWYASGADSCIYKPANVALLQTVVRGALDYWQAERIADSTSLRAPGEGDVQARTRVDEA